MRNLKYHRTGYMWRICHWITGDMQAVISKQKEGEAWEKSCTDNRSITRHREACAVKFASNGYNLIINGKNDGMALLKIKEKVIKFGAECIAVVDVCDYEAMKTL